jgi:vacuolar-type H+-ATPase subunit E/Vma4
VDEDAEAARRGSEALHSKEAELRAAMSRELAQARADSQRRVLEARDALLERVFAGARELLGEAIGQPAAQARLVIRAQEALGFVPAGGAVITCSPGVASVLEGELDAGDSLRIETQLDLPAGFQVTGAGGALVVDATLESLLELRRPLLAIEVLRWLESEQP